MTAILLGLLGAAATLAIIALAGWALQKIEEWLGDS